MTTPSPALIPARPRRTAADVVAELAQVREAMDAAYKTKGLAAKKLAHAVNVLRTSRESFNAASDALHSAERRFFALEAELSAMTQEA
ncbi:hypothetical protein [Microbacterium sp. XT11]|uniref:hypothetical protein n=1 Tax=Microbacterium sp. XT11 TaxID=367477 RepID=UPI0008356098|nr:hypothetical protein [Microbacterium sp. XT11]